MKDEIDEYKLNEKVKTMVRFLQILLFADIYNFLKFLWITDTRSDRKKCEINSKTVR